jgi:hypothetical protein
MATGLIPIQNKNRHQLVKILITGTCILDFSITGYTLVLIEKEPELLFSQSR